jgi:hypothetical protein
MARHGLVFVLRGRVWYVVAWLWAFVLWFLAEVLDFHNPLPFAVATAVAFATVAVLIRVAVTLIFLGPLSRRESFLKAWCEMAGRSSRSLTQRRGCYTDPDYRQLYAAWVAEVPRPAAANRWRTPPAPA